MTKIEIPRSKKKMFLALLGSLIFALLGMAFILNPEKFVSYIFRNAELIRISGIAAIIFSTLCILYISIKLFDKKPGLTIDQKGITDNSNYNKVGLIEWNEIIGIRTEQVMSTKFLLIDVRNPEKFIKNASKIKASLMKANMKMYNTPLSVSSTALKYSFENLENLIETEFEKYKEKPNS
jgi:hypothetical protein